MSKAPNVRGRSEAPIAGAGTGSNAPELTVSELSGAIKRALEDGFGHVRLRGEISGYRGPHSSGHCYFALKDDKAKIEAVIWRGVFSRLAIRPEEGMEVIAQGRVTTFPGSSKYQIVIEAMEPAGIGALMAILEERKRKLAAEGLFAPERKRVLPFWPRVVGIVTSPTGAVIRDMLHGFDERCPTRVVVWPVRVQGEGSAAEVAAAVRGFNGIAAGGRLPRPEVLIVARGGGSLEDLWGFNDEAVVRAVAESAIPVISAVGHETDWTLIDLVADARAPTPTKAAEWAVPKHADLVLQTGELGMRLKAAVRRSLDTARAHLKAATRGLPRLADLLALPRQRFDAVERRLGRALVANTRAHAMRHARAAARLSPRLVAQRIERGRNRLDMAAAHGREALARLTGVRRTRLERLAGRLQPRTLQHRLERAGERLAVLSARGRQALANGLDARRRHLDGFAGLLRSLSYQSALARGFALIRDEQGRMLRRAGAVAEGMRLDIEFTDGRVTARTESVRAGGEPRSQRAGAMSSGGADKSNLPDQPSDLSSEPRRKGGRSGGRGGAGGQGTLF